MKKRLRYEKPFLASLTDDRSCQGASCLTGGFINDGSCMAGSCYELSACDDGSAARACGYGSNACQGDAAFTCCASGGGVSGGQFMGGWDCGNGSRACNECWPTGNQAMWCGGGGTPV